MKRFDGLSVVNIEITTRCNKHCWMCWRTKQKKKSPLYIGADMETSMLEPLAGQLPSNIIVQFHINGEPLVHANFGKAISFFHRQIRTLDTNGKMLIQKADEIINNLDSITISVFEDDAEADEQFEQIAKFIEIKGARSPHIIFRCSGDVDTSKYEFRNTMIVKRPIHSNDGKYKYKKKQTRPEYGICLDAFSHMAIHQNGDVCPCICYDSNGINVMGNFEETPLLNIWHGEKRQKFLRMHIEAKRNDLPLCGKCEYWGVPG